MNRAATRFGDMITALASFGILTSVGHLHGDLDVRRPRLDRLDLTHRYAQDADLVTGVEPDGRGEVGGELAAQSPVENSTYAPPTSTATSAMMVTVRSPLLPKRFAVVMATSA